MDSVDARDGQPQFQRGQAAAADQQKAAAQSPGPQALEQAQTGQQVVERKAGPNQQSNSKQPNQPGKQFTDSQNELVVKHFRTDLQKQVSSGFIEHANRLGGGMPAGGKLVALK